MKTWKMAAPIKLSPVKLAFVASIVLVFLHNSQTIYTFCRVVFENSKYGTFFILFSFILFVSFFNLVLVLVSIPYFMKPFLSFSVMCSSIISYGMLRYKAVFNMEMVRNVFETHYDEAISWVNTSSVTWFLLTGVGPACALYFVNTGVSVRWTKGVAARMCSVAVSLIFISLFFLVYKKEPIYIARVDPSLRSGVVPFSFLVDLSKYAFYQFFKEEIPFTAVGEDAKRIVREGGKPVLMFFVIGESARAKNFSMNGYDRETNPFTSRIENLISYQDVHSCGTNTAVSVPCMFSRLGREGFDPDSARRSENLLDVMQRVGIEILWKENNSNCYGICNRVPVSYQFLMKNSDYNVCSGKTFCLDEAVLGGIDEEIAGIEGGGRLVIFHIYGSHVKYYDRYPRGIARFFPECSRGDMMACSLDELVNNYDNSILYTDSIIAAMVDVLKAHQEVYDTALLYVSDHGESLGEGGVYIHSAPYESAPEEQIHIPMQIWLSDGLAVEKGIDRACLRDNAVTKRYSHDNLFASMLGLWDIQTEVYDPAQDIFRPCRRP